MIKASSLGSSVGVYKVKNEVSFHEALAECFKYSDRVLLEECISGRELECGVVGNLEPFATEPGEIVLKKDYEFYTYEAKYKDEDAIDIVIPAKIHPDVGEKIKIDCIKAFKALNCNDYARIDVFLVDDEKVIINEVNTIPGFTNVSMFPMLCQNVGIGYEELITKLLDLAWERWNIENTFLTSYADA